MMNDELIQITALIVAASYVNTVTFYAYLCYSFYRPREAKTAP